MPGRGSRTAATFSTIGTSGASIKPRPNERMSSSSDTGEAWTPCGRRPTTEGKGDIMATSPVASTESQPWLHQHGREVQAFGRARLFPLGLSLETRLSSCQRLNRILADTQILYALYKKHHWQVRGATFYQLHLLLDKHAGEQLTLVDTLAERGQTLGGLAVGDARHVAEITAVPRPPDGAEEVPAMLSRLLEAHEIILAEAHDAAARGAQLGDDGRN